jgi:hypothetical protein
VVENYKITNSNYAGDENEVNEEIYLLYDYLPVLYRDEWGFPDKTDSP